MTSGESSRTFSKITYRKKYSDWSSILINGEWDSRVHKTEQPLQGTEKKRKEKLLRKAA